MTIGRTSLRRNGAPGSTYEYPGDLPAFSTTYVDPSRTSSIGQRLRVPGSTVTTGSPMVSRVPNRAGMDFFYSHGAVKMPVPLPGPPGYGNVVSSPFQRENVQLQAWSLIRSLFRAGGYPRNLGLSIRTAQPQTNSSGGPGRSIQTVRPIFGRVQTVPRSRAAVGTYATRSAR